MRNWNSCTSGKSGRDSPTAIASNQPARFTPSFSLQTKGVINKSWRSPAIVKTVYDYFREETRPVVPGGVSIGTPRAPVADLDTDSAEFASCLNRPPRPSCGASGLFLEETGASLRRG